MKGDICIRTSRLMLRNMKLEDSDFVVELRTDENVYKYFKNREKIDKNKHILWYKNIYLKDDNRIDFVALCNDKRIGVFGIKRENHIDSLAEISYILSSKEYNKGFAKEALESIIKYARENWKVGKIIATINKNNEMSISFIRKMGFELEKEDDMWLTYKKKFEKL